MLKCGTILLDHNQVEKEYQSIVWYSPEWLLSFVVIWILHNGVPCTHDFIYQALTLFSCNIEKLGGLGDDTMILDSR